ncbi:hypothetical protein [Bradyrhizobium retamae]|uniref:hypothetical protein n=1 Tax=Bradyrhizobium retamae TaxID=1300035 RepID=UPI000A7D5C07|nr:hypothetical protein [Bradyrhizobium retamae]
MLLFKQRPPGDPKAAGLGDLGAAGSRRNPPQRRSARPETRLEDGVQEVRHLDMKSAVRNARRDDFESANTFVPAGTCSAEGGSVLV